MFGRFEREDLVLLGTGAADGWPNPYCALRLVHDRPRDRLAARADVGAARRHAAARLRPRDAARRAAGRPRPHRAAARAAHPRPPGPQRAGVPAVPGLGRADEPLDVVGPPEVIEQARSGSPPTPRCGSSRSPPASGTAPAGTTVRVLAAAARRPPAPRALRRDRPRRARLLYATDTGPLPEATVAASRDAAFDVVLLEETFGDHRHARHRPPRPGARSPTRCGGSAASAPLTDDTDVVAVHLSHHNPPDLRAARRLAAWGAPVVDDGTARRPASRGREPHRPAGRAARWCSAAPGPASRGRPSGCSPPSRRDLRRHRLPAPTTTTSGPSGCAAPRPTSRRTGRTLETTRPRARCWRADGGPLLVDCLTLWLTRVLDRHGGWDDATGRDRRACGHRQVDALVEAWRTTRRRVVAVSNEVGQGVVPATASGRRFRDQLGRLNAPRRRGHRGRAVVHRRTGHAAVTDALRLCLGTLTVLRVRPPDHVDRRVAGRAMVLAPLVGLGLRRRRRSRWSGLLGGPAAWCAAVRRGRRPGAAHPRAAPRRARGHRRRAGLGPARPAGRWR